MTLKENFSYLLDNKIINIPTIEKSKLLTLITKSSIKPDLLLQIEKNLIDYFDKVKDLNPSDKKEQKELIKNIDYILSFASYMYYSGNGVMENSLYDNENGQQTLIDSYFNNKPSKDNSYFNLLIKTIFNYNNKLLNKDLEEVLDEEHQRMYNVVFNPTTSLNLENIASKDMSQFVIDWAEKKGIKLSILEKLLSTFQDKVPVVGEEGSTIVKSTDISEIEESIEKAGNANYQPKLDGLSGYLHMKKGPNGFVFSGLYGRGGKTDLTNITYKASMIKSIPQKLKVDNSIEEDINEIEIRGEIIIKKHGSTEETLKLINDKLKEYKIETRYTNLRNAAAGMIKNEALPPEILEEFLDFVPFHLYTIDKDKNSKKLEHSKTTNIYEINNMEQIPNIRIDDPIKARAFYDLMDFISNGLEHKHLETILGKKIYKQIVDYPYECDGVILTELSSTGKVNSNNELIGVSALKFSAPTAQTKIIGIKTEMNKSNISFVVQIEDTNIGGVTVKNVSGAVKQTKDVDTFLQIYHIGQEIEIARSGGVIPNLLTPIDKKSEEVYQLVFNKLNNAINHLLKNKIINKEEHFYITNALKDVFSGNYNSTSKTHWMNLKIEMIYNNLINSKTPLKDSIKDSLSYIVNKAFEYHNSKTIVTKKKKELDKFLKEDFINYTIEENQEFKDFEYIKPESCPSCNEPLVSSETNKLLSCVNDSCQARRTAKLTSYLLGMQKKGNKTNINDRKMEAILTFLQEKYYTEGENQTIITDIIKFYEMIEDPNFKDTILSYSETTKDIENPIAFGEKRVDKLISDIKNTFNTKQSVFLGNIGIDNFVTSGKKLLQVIDFEELINLDYSDEKKKKEMIDKITDIHEFGYKTAILVVDFISKHQKDIQKLISLIPLEKDAQIVKVESDLEINVTGTGAFSYEFFHKTIPEQTSLKLDIPYKDIPSTERGGKDEIKQVLKAETLVLSFDGQSVKFVGGGSPTGKTNIVMSDKIGDAFSKVKGKDKLNTPIVLDDLSDNSQLNQFFKIVKNGFIDENGNKIMVVTTTEMFLKLFNNNNDNNNKISKSSHLTL